jgi:DNA-binding NtrC family response regulator
MADRNLVVRLQLANAEAFGACGRPHDGARLLALVIQQNAEPPLEVVAELSRVSGFLALNSPAASVAYYQRAVRIYDALGHLSAKASTEVQLRAVICDGSESQALVAEDPHSSFAMAVECCAALSYVARHPRLLGAEVLALFQATGIFPSAVLLEDTEFDVCHSTGSRQKCAVAQDRAVSPYGTRIRFGTAHARGCELQIEAGTELRVQNTLKAVERLVTVFSAFEKMRQDEREGGSFLPELAAEEQLGLVYASKAMTDLVRITRQVAPKDVTVLITGDTGVGKELFARALHSASGRAGGPFIPFNCTTVPRDMLDSQLFGYRRGSFTGAAQEYPGLIRTATGGTLFLDEIGEMSLDVQPKLLRFLESGEILPLGETQPIHVSVRVVAATNADLDELVADGRFREDLYYRLHVIRLRIPPLRDRREEIPLLVRAIVDRLARECQRVPLRLSEEALEYLTMYHWPGNARQLTNELHRLMLLTEPDALITAEHLSPEIGGGSTPMPLTTAGASELSISKNQPLAMAVQRVERTLIAHALDLHAGNLERAASALGLSRKGLFLKRQRLGFDKA